MYLCAHFTLSVTSSFISMHSQCANTEKSAGWPMVGSGVQNGFPPSSCHLPPLASLGPEDASQFTNWY